MKIKQFTAENIKKLKVVEITPKGSMVQITGANGQGKSSVLDAIEYAICGTVSIPSAPVRKGAGKAKIRLDLGDVVVTRRFIEGGGTSLAVENAQGASYKSPQKMLDDLMGRISFDPLGFTRLHPKEQLEELRRLVKLEINLDEIDQLNEEDYKKRTEVGRLLRGLQSEQDAIAVPENLPAESIDLTKLTQELAEAGEKNAAISAEKNRRDYAKRRIEELRSAARKQRDEAERLRRLAETIDAEANRIETEADALGEGELKMPALEAFVDLAVLTGAIEEGRRHNKLIEDRDRRRQVEAKIAETENEQTRLTNAIEARNKQKTEAIAKAEMPVPGLGFGDGEVLYNDLPLNVASDAEQLRVSVAIAMAANPKLRVIRIRDGSLLDDKNLALIAEMAEKGDYQVWIERVDTSGKVGIVMEDGQVVSVHDEPEKESAPAPKKGKGKKHEKTD